MRGSQSIMGEGRQSIMRVKSVYHGKSWSIMEGVSISWVEEDNLSWGSNQFVMGMLPWQGFEVIGHIVQAVRKQRAVDTYVLPTSLISIWSRVSSQGMRSIPQQSLTTISQPREASIPGFHIPGDFRSHGVHNKSNHHKGELCGRRRVSMTGQQETTLGADFEQSNVHIGRLSHWSHICTPIQIIHS